MTRAKDRLVLSGGMTGRTGQDTVLSLLSEIVPAGLGDPEVAQFSIGDAAIGQTVVPAQAPGHVPRFGWAGELKPADHDSSVIETWTGRTERWREAQQRPRALTPSMMVEALPDRRQRRGRKVGEERSRRISQVIGVLAHRLLERWDYGASTAEFPRLIEALCRPQLPPDCEADRAQIQADLEKLFDAFGRSEPYRLLQTAELLGREVPFSIPWEQGEGQARGKGPALGQVMTGTIDVIYRLDGQVWVVDYKTDDVGVDELPELVRRYAWQAQVYQAAVRQALAIDAVGFQFIVLRQGLMIPG